LVLSVGGHDRVASGKKAETYSAYDITHKKTRSKHFQFFKISMMRKSSSLEGLNSSLGHFARNVGGAKCNKKKWLK